MNIKIADLDTLEEILESYYDIQPRKVDKSVVIYGAGNLGLMAKQFFDYFKFKIEYMIDNKLGNNSFHPKIKDWKGKAIYTQEYVNRCGNFNKSKKNDLLVVCIEKVSPLSLMNELRFQGWHDVVFFYDITEAYKKEYPLTNGWTLRNLYPEEKGLIRSVFSKLDPESRKHYVQFLAWRRLRMEMPFEGFKIDTENRYFIPEVVSVLHDHEVFVDCGAYHGETTLKFIKLVNKKYREVHLFEPDVLNYDNIMNISVNKRKNQMCISYLAALGDSNSFPNFYSGFGYASKLDKKGNSEIGVHLLDEFHIHATFIKMHLEGGEFDALSGAEETIRKYRPILAVTIYHNSEGVYRIPIKIISYTPSYRYYVRCHSYAGQGVVFYAIPEERFK